MGEASTLNAAAAAAAEAADAEEAEGDETMLNGIKPGDMPSAEPVDDEGVLAAFEFGVCIGSLVGVFTIANGDVSNRIAVIGGNC